MSNTARYAAAFFLGLTALPAQIAIYNGATNVLRFPIAPGSFAKVNGNFAGTPTASADRLPLPRELGGIQVFVNNVAAPLYAVRADEISFQVPRAATAGNHPFRITRGGAEIASSRVDVLDAAPGIFFAVGDPNAQGGILNQAGAFATRDNPARRGQIIQIFGTGEGPLASAVEDGAIPTGLVSTRNEARCFVSVDPAVIQFSGASPQFPGLWQVNAVVPDRPYITGQVPLFCTINGISTNNVTFWVAQ
jgi:uncharacterized protein (TIGR03437 family)